MKKMTVLVLLLLLVTAGIVTAQEEQEPQFEPLMAPGNLAVNGGLGYGFFWGAIDVSGGVELMLARIDLGGTLPLTFGVAGKGYYYSDPTYYTGDYDWSWLGGGGFATVHFGLRDLNLDENMQWLANVDTYVGVGAAFYSYTNSFTGVDNEFKIFPFATTAGVNYFLTPNIAITAEGGYYGGWGGGGLIGLLVKL
jgi:hypothetical protein